MSSEGPTPPQAPETADDEIRELAEFAAGIVADAERLCDRVAELHHETFDLLHRPAGWQCGMEPPAVVDAADQLHMAARAAVRALTGVVEDIDAGWGERWLPR